MNPRCHVRTWLPARRRARRGTAVGLLVAALVIVVGIVAVTWSVANLSLEQAQRRAACEAAALAAAAELLDEDVLWGRANPQDDIFAARAASLAYIHANPVSGRPAPLDLNFGNAPSGDVVVGRVANPRRVHAPLEVWTGKGPIDSIGVTAARSHQRGQGVGTWLGALLGLSQGSAAAAARASLDHRVYGFRPQAHTSIPLIPLAASGPSWLEQAADFGGANDQFTVDYRRGYIFDGGDGVPEIVLRADLAAGPGGAGKESAGRFASLVLCRAGWGESLRQREVADGLRRSDLVELGGEFALGPDGTLTLPVVEQFDASWCDVLWALRGQVRVWPLGTPASVMGGQAGWQLTGFGAAVICTTRIDDTVEPAQLVVTLQPAMLATSTALTSDAAAENPWIAKLSLTQ